MYFPEKETKKFTLFLGELEQVEEIKEAQFPLMMYTYFFAPVFRACACISDTY